MNIHYLNKNTNLNTSNKLEIGYKSDHDLELTDKINNLPITGDYIKIEKKHLTKVRTYKNNKLVSSQIPDWIIAWAENNPKIIMNISAIKNNTTELTFKGRIFDIKKDKNIITYKTVEPDENLEIKFLFDTEKQKANFDLYINFKKET